MTRWAILTGEYPPDPGGVSDYTDLIARGLAAAGDDVSVFAPPARISPANPDAPIRVHRLAGRFGPRTLGELHAFLSKRPRPHRILVQYVPHAFGYKAMNLAFAMWVSSRLQRVAPLWVMFHEVVFPMRWRPMKHLALGLATRAMARMIAGAAERIFVSAPAWGDLLRRVCPRAIKAEWLPVPCTLDFRADPAAIRAVRDRFNPTGVKLVGHFGTYGPAIDALLEPAAVDLLSLVPDAAVLLLGRGAAAFHERLASKHPSIAARIHSMGELSGPAVSAHLRACNLMLQPYADGITSRRTSAMAGLANEVPLVTNLGPLSEPIWVEAVAAAPLPDPIAMANLAASLLGDAKACDELVRRGAALYRERFSLERSIARLRVHD